jgi:hypothetical protein
MTSTHSKRRLHESYPKDWSEDDIDTYDERAAIGEFDGGLPRREAQKMAYGRVMAAVKNRKGI